MNLKSLIPKAVQELVSRPKIEVDTNTRNNKDIQNPTNPQNAETSELNRIKSLVQRFRVCWEVYPEQTIVGKERRDIGFSLELYGTHEPGVDHVNPGCNHCRVVQFALNEIAKWILPREERASRYEVAIDTRSLSYSKQRADRPDVRATIQILHRGPWDQPIDPCEVRCLSDMEHSLSELGACKQAWTPSRHESSPP